jgi:hypothetical protein
MTKGVIYYNTSTKCLVRLVVSIYSLRKHYTGPIAILSEGDESRKYCQPIAEALGCEFVESTFDVPEGPQMTFMKKTLLHTVTPYDVSVFLDSDTLVTGNIDKLFEWAEQYEFVATNFANWNTKGKIMSGRIKQWQKHHPGFIDKALEFGPALNAGCYAFRKDAKFLKVWFAMTLPGRDINLPEETSMQVILPAFPNFVAPQEYNCSCKFSNPFDPDVRIIHYHRNKHCRIGLPYGASLWMSYFDKVLAKDIASISKWHLEFDRTLASFLRDRDRSTAVIILEDDKKALAVPPVTDYKSIFPISPDKLTIVSAISPNMVYALKANFPTWQAKSQFAGVPIIIFHNGFENPEKDLDFVLKVPNARLIHWTMPKYDSIRELMISAFVLGSAEHVKTEYFLKLDADSYFSGREDVFDQSHFDNVLCGHRWGVSRLIMLQNLDFWAAKIGLPGKAFLSPEDSARVCDWNVKFKHPRIISWICLHQTKFVKQVAELTGNRLPVPSHDTLLWYMAWRLDLPWKGAKLNSGTGHGKRLSSFLDAHKKLREQGFIVNG